MQYGMGTGVWEEWGQAYGGNGDRLMGGMGTGLWGEWGQAYGRNGMTESYYGRPCGGRGRCCVGWWKG